MHTRQECLHCKHNQDKLACESGKTTERLPESRYFSTQKYLFQQLSWTGAALLESTEPGGGSQQGLSRSAFLVGVYCLYLKFNLT